VGEELQGVEAVHPSYLAGLGRPEGWVPMATRDGGERDLDGGVDAVLKGGDGGAAKLHEIKAKLLEVLVWLEKGRGKLSTVARSGGNGARRRRRSSGTNMREWRRIGYEASVGCSGAGGAWNCGCGAAEAADNGEQSVRQWSGGVLSGEEAEEAKCGRASG
jgi:hypothetical protein